LIEVARWPALACAGALLGCLSAPAAAHDLITDEAAERYLTQAGAQLEMLNARQSAQRAQASYALGRMLDEIRDLLNRDLATHGRVQGLATQRLVAQLDARGLPLRVSPQLGRFPANLGYYREALRLSPDGPRAADAAFALLQGYFYDSFGDDPLQPRDQTWSQLEEQIGVGERFLERAPRHTGREEGEFIVLVHHIQAARSAPDAAARTHHARRARRAAERFAARYPDSMRAAALPVLLERLGSGL
jgi:tetratricopeptide (TPR) repeat protein